MLDLDIDDLDHKILKIISNVKYWSAEDVYSELTGFTRGRFGRTLINLKLSKLVEKGLLDIDVRMRKGEHKDVYSIKNNVISYDE